MSNLIYLGKSEKIPFEPTPLGEVELIEKKELVVQSMLDILATPKGTILGVEEYGSLIYKLTFIPNNAILESLLIFFITRAIFDWEKRVKIISVDCTVENEVQMNCYITFKILASNEIDAFVFPFYKELKS